MRKVNCKICGKEFETRASNACYCSAECKIAGARALRKEWERQHPTYNADFYRQKREEQKNGAENEPQNT